MDKRPSLTDAVQPPRKGGDPRSRALMPQPDPKNLAHYSPGEGMEEGEADAPDTGALPPPSAEMNAAA